MKRRSLPCLFLVAVVAALASGVCLAAQRPPILVSIEGPSQELRMGDTPTFKGTVTNAGSLDLEGLVVYLSLVSLKQGDEHPVDLEDWSAQKAVRIDKLTPGQASSQDWPMRLIEAGDFAVALTVVEPREKQPVVSDLVRFAVKSKQALSSPRVIAVAVGEPLFLALLYAFYLALTRPRRPLRGARPAGQQSGNLTGG